MRDVEYLQLPFIRKLAREVLSAPGAEWKLLPLLKKHSPGFTMDTLKHLVEQFETEANLPQPTLGNVGELVAEPLRAQWVVTDLIPARGCSLLAAPPKLGKSTLVRYLAWCVATGTRFLEYEIMEAGPVLWVTGDESRNELNAGWQRILKTYGDPGNIYFAQGHVPKEGYLDFLEDYPYNAT